MDFFGDIVKYNTNFDETLDTRISRYYVRHGKETKILVTESVNLAALYKTSGAFLQTDSWVFPQLNRLKIPAVISHDSTDAATYLLAVQEPNTLTKWSFGAKKSRLAKHVFKANICGLIAFDFNDVEPITIYDKGFCQSISTAIDSKSEEMKKAIISDDEDIQFMYGMVDNKNKNYLIIYLITKRLNSSNNSVYKITFDIEKNDIIGTDRQSLVNSFSNFTLCPKSSAVLSVTKVGEQLTLFSLNGRTEKQLFDLTSTSITTVISICSTIGGNVCLIGKTEKSDFIVELWELRYGSKLGQLELPYEPLTNDSKVLDNKLFITCFKGIISIPIVTENISLSQMIDRNKALKPNRESDTNQELNKIYSELSLNPIQSFDDLNSRFGNIIKHQNYLICEEVILKLLIIGSSIQSNNNKDSGQLFFHRLLTLPFNELFMISKLKSLKLDLKQVLKILRLLTDLLSLNNYSIIDWISIIIDAHINLFIMNPSPEIVELVLSIEEEIDRFGDVCQQLGQIKTLFELILTKNNRKQIDVNLPKPKRGEYCIEFLRF